MITRKHIRLVLLAVVSAASFGLAISVVGGNTIVDAAADIDGGAVMLAGLLILINTGLVFIRFRSVLMSFGYRPGWRDSLLAFTTGQISNQILFNVVGQSLSRAALLASAGIPFGVSVVATYWERLLAAALLLLLSLVGAAYVFVHIGIDLKGGGAYLVSLMSAMTLVCVVVLSAFLRKTEFRSWLTAVPGQILRFWPAAILTLLAHGTMAAAYAVLLRALHVETISPGIISALFIVMFSASLPISFSGWGIRELSAAQALAAVGVSSTVGVTAAVVIGLLGMAVMLLGGGAGVYLFIHRRMKPVPVAPPAGENTAFDQDRWLGLAATTAAVVAAILLFFQIRLPGDHTEITANAADIVAITGLGMLLMFAWSRRGFRPLPAWLIGSMAAISVLFVFSLGLGYVRFGSNGWALMNRGFGWLIISGYVSLGALIAMSSRRDAGRWVLGVYVLSGTTVAAIELVLTVVSLFGVHFPTDAFVVPLTGYASNSNAFAFQMSMTACCLIAADRMRLSGQKPHLTNIALIIVMAAVYHTQSRAGIGMTTIAMILSVIFAPTTERARACRTAIIALLAYAFLLGLPEMINFLNISITPYPSMTFSRDSSDSERWLTIIQGWDLWLEHPILGSGLGAYVQHRIVTGQGFLVIHSVPVWLLAETGLVGLILLTIVLALIVRAAFQMMNHPATSGWGSGLLFITACMTAAGLVHDFFFQRPFWFLLGLFVAAAAKYGRNSKSVFS